MARKENSNAKLVLLLFLLLLLLLPFCNVKWPSMMRLRFFSIQQERGSISFLIRLLYSSSLLRRSIWWCFLSFFFPFLFAFFCFVLFVRHSSASFILCESRRLLALGVFPSDLSMDFFFLFFSFSRLDALDPRLCRFLSIRRRAAFFLLLFPKRPQIESSIWHSWCARLLFEIHPSFFGALNLWRDDERCVGGRLVFLPLTFLEQILYVQIRSGPRRLLVLEPIIYRVAQAKKTITTKAATATAAKFDSFAFCLTSGSKWNCRRCHLCRRDSWLSGMTQHSKLFD